MSIFGKPVEQIVFDDLAELLADRAVENVRLEFKREIPDKDETLKKLSSFANTFGGDLIVGAAAGSADGRITELPGVDKQSGYKQTLMQWCFAGTTPPLTAEVSDPIPAPTGASKVCYVIRVPESDVAPHFLNGRKGMYVRSDEFSSRFQPQLANESEFRHLFERRRLVQERRAELIKRARERFATFATRPQGEPGEHEYLGSRMEVVVLPRFPVRPVCGHVQLMKFASSTRVGWRQFGFPYSPDTAISQHESAILLKPCIPPESRSYVELNIWGLAYYTILIGERRQEFTGIHTPGFIGHLLVFIRHAYELFQSVGYAGPLYVEMFLENIRGIPWLSIPIGFAEHGASSELDNAVTFALETTTDELQEENCRLARSLLALVFFAINWPRLADSPQKLDELVAAGYYYNRWGPPPRAA